MKTRRQEPQAFTPDKDTITWLLEEDNPNVRYLTLRYLLSRPEDDPQLRRTREDIMQADPVATILEAQQAEGYWVRSGGGFSPSYTSSLYQIYFLAELGALPEDERVQRGCEYFLNNGLASSGGVSMSRKPVPSSVVHCMNGDLLASLIRLGRGDDPRVQRMLEWQINAILDIGGVKFQKSATCAPNFACGNNAGAPCAWGSVKALKGLSAVPETHRTPELQEALQRGADLLLSVDPVNGAYPGDIERSATWFTFGFPMIYRTDVLEAASLLAGLGYGQDPRLDSTFDLIMEKRNSEGRWILEKSLNGKMWCDIEEKKQPSKWITYRALRALKMAGRWI